MSELGTPRTVAAPELLAPAGNWECAVAATENGANAIYFGLDSGFNARARAANFAPERLPELMQFLHHRGVKGYTTLNTLVFTDELPALQKNLYGIAEAGVDAVLVQDLGVARIVKQICPDIEVHASTQMTLTCAAAIDMAEQLGVSRVVLARECSLKEIKQITAATRMPVEVFVHGALCVAYSGQCLTSESLGGRSANRGQCAQACRLPYDMICDGKDVDLGPVRYLLSPQDLAAYALIPELIEAGVCSLKIEGRLKTPEYVANITSHYRQAIDRAMQGLSVQFTPESQREMELSFSRGFTPGWLEGCNHKRLVPGESSAKKGVLVGEVIDKRGDRLHAQLHVPLAKGDGIVLEGDRAANEEIGGRVFDIRPLGPAKPSVPRSKLGPANPEAAADDRKIGGVVEISFARGLIANADVFAGQKIWQTDDPQLNKRLRQSFTSADPMRRVPLDIHAQIELGQPLRLTVSAPDMEPISVEHEYQPQVAQRHALDLDTLKKQFSRLGSTVYDLYEISADIGEQVMVPLSILGQWRHAMIEAVEAKRLAIRSHEIQPQVDVGVLLKSVSDAGQTPADSKPILRVLCRTLKQLRQALDLGAEHLIADFHDLREYKQAVAWAREAGRHLLLATLRIHKEGEDGLFLNLAKHASDGWLARNLAAIRFAQKRNIPFVADFSLNITNPLSAEQLVQWGAQRVTASYDLNRDQLLELVAATPPQWLEVVIHQHMPMFHMEHCVFCTVLSPGTNKTNCGRPCDRHAVKLRDRIGSEHVLHADIGCRNTLYNGTAQSGAEAVSGLLQRGIRSFRIEMLNDTSDEDVKLLITLYRQLLAGELPASEVWRQLKAANRVGVTRGTLEHPRNPLAIL
jgi:putative protease